MRKQNLFELTAEVRKIIGELPIIVGSQAIFAITDFPPEIVQKSVECDFLLLKEFAKLRPKLDEKLGIFSKRQQETGFYADILGLATVVLPDGWQNRVTELKDENEKVLAFCVEIHDIAISKLMAGREKDFKFLQNAFEANYLQIEIFLERAEMILQHPAANALRPRLLKLIKEFEKFSNLRETVEELKKFSINIENNK
ncbi:MAG: hypothetical protein M3405_06990 [Acidobacteriota bacterium]|nr:hypothetical protein [Acidobacteriota bacterium]